MLEEVRHKHAVEVPLGELGGPDVTDHLMDPGSVTEEVDHVDRPPFGRRHRGDELAPAGGGVEHALRTAEPVVELAGDLSPHRFARPLADPAEAELVEALVVDAPDRIGGGSEVTPETLRPDSGVYSVAICRRAAFHFADRLRGLLVVLEGEDAAGDGAERDAERRAHEHVGRVVHLHVDPAAGDQPGEDEIGRRQR